VTQPNIALETVKPEKAVSHHLREPSMKLALIEFTAPEISAGS
jgi:hypothetical protein